MLTWTRRCAALGAVLALSACSGSDTPAAVLPTLSAPSATPTTGALIVPAEAKAHTVFGAAAFVRFFFTELDKAYQAGTPFPLDGLADPQCESCKNFAGVADKLAAEGHHFGEATFIELTAEAPPIDKGFSIVSFTSALPKNRTTLDAGGKVLKTVPQDPRLRMQVAVKLVPTGWIVREIRTIA